MTCTSCGAQARPEATWCSQCHASFAPAAAQEAVVPGRLAPRVDPPRPDQVWSRWHRSDTSFGPVGRVAWTVGLTFFGLMFLWSGNIFAVVAWCGIAMPLVLRSVWARARVS